MADTAVIPVLRAQVLIYHMVKLQTEVKDKNKIIFLVLLENTR